MRRNVKGSVRTAADDTVRQRSRREFSNLPDIRIGQGDPYVKVESEKHTGRATCLITLTHGPGAFRPSSTGNGHVQFVFIGRAGYVPFLCRILHVTSHSAAAAI